MSEDSQDDAVNASPGVETQIAEGAVTGLQLTVLALCCTINALDGFDILAISFIAAEIADEWSLAPDELGLLFSGSLIGMMIGAFTIAPLADRFGRKPVLIASLGLIATGMVATSGVASAPWLFIARVITGCGVGGVLPNINTLVAEYAPLKHRNMAISTLMIAYPIGAILAGVIVAWIMPVWGWRAVFLAGGLATLVIMPLLFLLLPESVHFLIDRRPRDALSRVNRILARMHLDPIEAMPPREVADDAPPSASELLAPEYRWRFLLLLTAFFMCTLVVYFVLSWTPKIIIDAGMGSELGIYGGTILNAGGIAATLLMGYLFGLYGLRRVLVTIYLLQAGLMIVFAYVVGGPVYLVLLITGLLGGCTHAGIVGLYTCSAWLFPTRLRSTGLGWAIGLGRSGAVIGPYLAGLLMSFGWSREAYFIVMGTPILLAAVAVWMIPFPKVGSSH